MTGGPKQKTTSLEEETFLQGTIALNRFGRQLTILFKDAEKRLWTRMAFITALASLLSWIGVFTNTLFTTRGDETARLNNAFEAATLAAIVAVLTIAGLYPILRRRELYLLKTVPAISRANIDLLSVLGKVTELRGGDTAGHNLRVTVYAILFAEAVKLPPESVVRVTKGALLHDVGKLVIPDRVLGKPGALTQKEREEIKTHVRRGSEIVTQSKLLSAATDIVAYHHERYDGNGYPHGLKGENIPLEARLFALVDVFDALTSPRVYKKALGVKEALETMSSERGTHFDPKLFDYFMELAPTFARKLPKEEPALATMLMGRLTPYLDHFLLGQSLPKH